MSILKRPSTQPSGDRWGFEMASNQKDEDKAGSEKSEGIIIFAFVQGSHKATAC